MTPPTRTPPRDGLTEIPLERLRFCTGAALGGDEGLVIEPGDEMHVEVHVVRNGEVKGTVWIAIDQHGVG